jgi:DNA invertase Pin-like site-specific DNA recombinase
MAAPVLSGHLVGYARVSTDDQDLSLQIDSVIGLGIDQENIFTEISGAKTDRPQLDACLAKLQQGDTLVVWRLDRLGRSMHPLGELIENVRNRGVGFRSVSDGLIDTTSPPGELIFQIFSALAQFERRLIQERPGQDLHQREQGADLAAVLRSIWKKPKCGLREGCMMITR